MNGTCNGNTPAGDEWYALGAAVQGRAHVKRQIPCQDKICGLCENGVHVTVLADGAGSARLSHYGAEAVCAAVCGLLAERFDQYYACSDVSRVGRDLMTHILETLAERADELRCRPSDLASTLLFTAVKGRYCLVGHLGDGVIGYAKDGRLSVLSAPDNGEFANETVFTTSKDALQHLELHKGVTDRIDGFALMSDGPALLLYSKRMAAFAPWLDMYMKKSQLLRRDRAGKRMQQVLETEIQPAVTDDCSLLLLVKDHGFPGYDALGTAEKAGLMEKASSPGHVSRRKLRQWDILLHFLEQPRRLNEIAAVTRIRRKYLKKRLRRLCGRDIVLEQHGKYEALLMMRRKKAVHAVL